MLCVDYFKTSFIEKSSLVSDSGTYVFRSQPKPFTVLILALEEMTMQDEAAAKNDSFIQNHVLYTNDEVPIYTLHLRNIPRNTNEDEIKLHFSAFGKVDSLNIVGKKRQKYRFGFITFSDPKSAARALRSMNKSLKNIIVRPADTWKQPKFEQHLKAKETKIEGKCPIMSLNDDCLTQIISYLEQNDIIKLAWLCVRFFNLIADHIKTRKLLDLTDAHDDFTLMEIRQIFKWFGEDIKVLKIISSSFICYRDIDFIAKYCHNLEELDLRYFGDISSSTYKRIFQASKNIKILSLVNGGLTDQDCWLIGEYLQVHTLNLSENECITGVHLSHSKHVVDLNLSDCSNLDPEDFHTAITELKLKALNIVGCYSLVDLVSENILKTQKDLESLTISTYLANHLYAVGKLHLKHVRIKVYNPPYDLYQSDCYFPYEALTELARHRKHDLESLELHDIRTNKEERHQNTITEFLCLKKLCIVRDKTLDNYCLDRISRACKLLEVVNVSESYSITIEGVVKLILNLPNLKSLNIAHCFRIHEDAIHQIYNVLESRKKEDAVPLILYVHKTQFTNYELMEEAARKYRKLLKLKFVLNRFAVKKYL